MTSNENPRPQVHPPRTPADIDGQTLKSRLRARLPSARLDELEGLPRRSAALHWFAFALSVLSLGLLATWFFGAKTPVSTAWILLDVALGVAFAIEFFTRSGFRWYRSRYMRARFFDFIAIIPALALVQRGLFFEGAVVWIVMIARFVRLVDRFLGDGFVTRNALALVEGLEEEITDRVLDRIVVRAQENVDRASFSHEIAEALERNRDSILERVRAATPREGLVPNIARIVGLDAALERAEERSFDAIVGIINSEEVDRAVRDAINSSFASLRNELGRRDWRRHLGIQRQRQSHPHQEGKDQSNDAGSE
jgi:hypothetical protein